MSFLRPTGSQWRTPQYGKSVIVNTWRGVIRVQSWPKKRGPAKDQATKTRQQYFAIIQGLIKRMHHRETEVERKALDEHNRTHRGQRGSAAIRHRDWITQRLYGRGILIEQPGWGTVYPAAVHRDASQILDHASDIRGSLLQATGTKWEGLAPGPAGALLTAGAAGQPNTYTEV